MEQESKAEHAAANYLYYRHTLPVRVMHWINVIALTILLMSGLNIFGAHPALYWGKSSYAGRPPILQIDSATRRQQQADRCHADLRSRVRHHRRVGSLQRLGWRTHEPRLSVVADHSRRPLAGNGPSMAFAFRLDLRDQRPVLRCLLGRQPPPCPRSCAHRNRAGARSGSRSSIICIFATRAERRRSAITCCRKSPT